LSNEVSSLADELATNVLSREELGANLVSAQKQGRTKLYEDYGNNLSTLMDKEGAAPVSMVSVNNIGASAIKQAQEKLTEGSSAASLMGASGYKEAQDLLALKPDLTFKQANEVRSKLLEKQRELEKGTVGYNIVNRAVSEINTAMDAAAEAVSPTLKESYKALNSGYKQAINELDPKLLATAANKYPEKIADSIISSGNVSSWKETQMMLNRAKSLGVDTTGLAENIQRAYLEKTFADGGLTNISNKLKDKATAEQFKAILPEAVQNRAKVIAKAGEMLSQRGKSIDLATAATLSSVLGASAGNVYSGDSMGAGYGAVAGLASLVIAPKIAAKIAYSSVATNKLLQASTAASKGNATAAALKLGEMYREIKVSPQEIQQLQAGPQQAVPLSAQEQQELEALRKELGGQ
jgi:membrane-associated HD superfamily phosphohydrolase